MVSVGDSAFGSCRQLGSVSIPQCLCTSWFSSVFPSSGITNLVIQYDVTDIGEGAFSGYFTGGPQCPVEIHLPYTLTNIGEHAFSHCTGLVLLEIPGQVECIAEGTFTGCSGLASLEIPDSVEDIGSGVFFGCESLSTLSVPASWKLKHVDGVFWRGHAKVPATCSIVYRGSLPDEATETTPVSVPLSWLEENAEEILDEYGGDYEAAAGAPAANGRDTVWQCYLTGIDPTDADAGFKMSAEWVDGELVIAWDPNLNEDGAPPERSYSVEGKASMMDEWGDADENSCFFRVKVELPE